MARAAGARPPSVRGTHFRRGAIETGTAAWILHRATGIFLTVYLMMHLVVVGQSVRSQEAFNVALKFVQQGVFVVLDAGLAGIVAYHGLNGLRVVAFDAGWGIRYQKQLFWISLALSVVVFVVSVWFARKLL